MPKRNLSSLLDRPEDQDDPTKKSDGMKRAEDSRSKMTMEDRVDLVRDKMSYSDRVALQREVESMERQFEADLRENRTKDPKVVRQYHYKKALLAHDDELTFSGNSREGALKEVKEIEALIVPEMPSKNEMWPRNDISAKAQALRHQQTFERKFDNPDPNVSTGGLVKRWQELKRRLEPENPFAHNLDSIRPERHVGEA